MLPSAQLTAQLSASDFAAARPLPLNVINPKPDGGTSGTSALVSIILFRVSNAAPGGGTVGLNHVVYEPYSRKLYASVSTGSSSVTANSVVSVDPLTGAFGTPFTFATAPNNLALSTSGNTLYTDLASLSTSPTSTSSLLFGRLDLAAGTSDSITLSLPNGSFYYSGFPVGGEAVQPGSENTLAVSRTNALPALYDYNSSSKTLVQRGTAGNVYYGSCINFLDAGNLLSTYSSVIDYAVSSAGLGTGKTLGNSDCLSLSGNVGATASGKIYNITSSNLLQAGSLVLPNTYSNGYGNLPALALDSSLKSAFYPGNTSTVTPTAVWMDWSPMICKPISRPAHSD